MIHDPEQPHTDGPSALPSQNFQAQSHTQEGKGQELRFQGTFETGLRFQGTFESSLGSLSKSKAIQN